MVILLLVVASYYFLLFFAFAPSHSFATFETFNHGQCFKIFTSGWREWYIVLITLNKSKIGTFLFICLAQSMASSLSQKIKYGVPL